MNGLTAAERRGGLLRSAWEALARGRVNRCVYLLQRAGLQRALTDTERARFKRLHEKMVRQSDLLASAATVKALR